MTVKHVTAGAIALLCLSAGTARAQQAPATTTTTTTTTQQVTTTDYGTGSQSIASGAVGSAWGGDADEGSWAFDGAFDYLHNGAYGFEFIGAFTPDFSLETFPTLDTRVNAYMANAIAAIPLGTSDNWLPFVSGGVGMFTIRHDFEEGDLGLDLDLDGNVDSPIDDNQFGGNIGFGLMGFANQVGFRADVRYYSGLGNNEGDREFVSDTFSDISYWRSTVGVSFRW
jgi:hypothetical protein